MKIVLGRFIKKKEEFDSENIVCPIKGYDRDKYLNRRIFFRILFILILTIVCNIQYNEIKGRGQTRRTAAPRAVRQGGDTDGRGTRPFGKFAFRAAPGDAGAERAQPDGCAALRVFPRAVHGGESGRHRPEYAVPAFAPARKAGAFGEPLGNRRPEAAQVLHPHAVRRRDL